MEEDKDNEISRTNDASSHFATVSGTSGTHGATTQAIKSPNLAKRTIPTSTTMIQDISVTSSMRSSNNQPPTTLRTIDTSQNVDTSSVKSPNSDIKSPNASEKKRKPSTIPYIAIVEALHDYKAPDSYCLDLRKGDIIYVHSKAATGWWDGTLNKKRGWFPSNFVAIKETRESKSSSATASNRVKTDSSSRLGHHQIQTSFSGTGSQHEGTVQHLGPSTAPIHGTVFWNESDGFQKSHYNKASHSRDDLAQYLPSSANQKIGVESAPGSPKPLAAKHLLNPSLNRHNGSTSHIHHAGLKSPLANESPIGSVLSIQKEAVDSLATSTSSIPHAVDSQQTVVSKMPEANLPDPENLQYTINAVAEAEKDLELPPYWKRRNTLDGEPYYFNIQTNETTYDLNKVMASVSLPRKSSFAVKDNRIIVVSPSMKELKLGPDEKVGPNRLRGLSDISDSGELRGHYRDESHGLDNLHISAIPHIESPLSPLDPDGLSWEILVNAILKAISDLNKAARQEQKSEFVPKTNEIVKAVRDMLACAGMMTKDSALLRTNKVLFGQHHSILVSLSKLVLTSTIAAGLWPPPDAIKKMRYQAGQVLLAVRHFVSVAQEAPFVELVKPSPEDLARFQIRKIEMSNMEMIVKLDQHSEIIMNAIAALVTQITHDRALSNEVVEHVRTTIVEVGQLMSLIEDIQCFIPNGDVLGPNSSSSSNLVADSIQYISDFKKSKEFVYSAANDLLSATGTTNTQFAPSNVLGMMLESTTMVVEAVEDVLGQSRLMIDHNHSIEEALLWKNAQALDPEGSITSPNSHTRISSPRAFTPAHSRMNTSNSVADDNAHGRQIPRRSRVESDPTQLTNLQRRALSLSQVYDDVVRESEASVVADKSVAGKLAELQLRTLHGGLLSYDKNERSRMRSADQPVSHVGHKVAAHLPTPILTSAPPPIAKDSSSRTGPLSAALTMGSTSSSAFELDRARRSSIGNGQSASRRSESMNRDQSALKTPEELQSVNKLAKFFGDESVKYVPIRSSEQMPWFLKKDYSPEDLTINMEGGVTGGTFAALVERLTLHDAAVDNTFASAFLLTFHIFSSPTQLFAALVSRFQSQAPDGLSPEELKMWNDQKLVPIQIRVSNALKLWLESFWIEQDDDACLDQIYAFATGTMAESQPTLAARIQELVQQKINNDVLGVKRVTSKVKRMLKPADEIPPPILPKSLKRFTLLELDPLEVARQLTLAEAAIFQQIMPIELMKQEWSKKKDNSLAVNVRAMTKMSTKLTGWVVATVVSEGDVKRRANTLKFFIKIADRCYGLNNFNTLLAIMSALNSSTVSRLKKTWEQLSTKTKTTFEALKRATDHGRNYSEYRAYLKKTPPPCLPFLGLYLTDLTFTDDGNANFRNEGKLINMDKYVKTARIIQDLQHFQVPYNLTDVPEIQDYLLMLIEKRGNHDAQELYEISLKLEPRETDSSTSGGGGPSMSSSGTSGNGFFSLSGSSVTNRVINAISPTPTDDHHSSSLHNPPPNGQEMQETVQFLEKAGLL